MTLNRTELRGVAEDYVRKGGLAGNIAMTTPGDTLALLNLLERAERSLLLFGAVDRGGPLWQPPSGATPPQAVVREQCDRDAAAQIQALQCAHEEREKNLRAQLSTLRELRKEDAGEIAALRARLPQAQAAVVKRAPSAENWLVALLREHGPMTTAEAAEMRDTSPGNVIANARNNREQIEDDGAVPVACRVYRLRAAAGAVVA